jgi:hypothetical protein
MEMVMKMTAVEQRFLSPQMKCILDLCVTLFFGALLFTAALMQIICGRLHASCLVWLTKVVVGGMGRLRKLATQNSLLFILDSS